MSSQSYIDSIAEDVSTIYQKNPTCAQDAIETYLLREFGHKTSHERQQAIDVLITRFAESKVSILTKHSFDDDQLLRFCSLLLGHPIEKGELEVEELQQRLTKALTTIFEILNQLIRTINLTLLEDNQSQETIRFLIGEQLEGNQDMKTLEEHLDQIRTAFVTSHRAFKRSVQITVEKILDELDPEKVCQTDSSGFKIGAFRKADAYDNYCKSYKDCHLWFESGRCMQEFLRTFEKQCAEMSKISRR